MKSIGKMVLTFVAVFVLFIPVIAVQQIDARTTAHIMTVEGNYINGTAFEFNTLIDDDWADTLEWMYQSDDEYGTAATNDSAFYGRKPGTGVSEVLYYGDRITYIGNGTYTCTVNQTELPEATWSTNRIMVIPTNVTFGDLLEYDFIRITCSEDIQPVFVSAATSPPIVSIATPTKISSTEWIVAVSLADRSYMQSNQDVYVVLTFNNWGNYDFPTDVTSFDFKVQGEVLTGADVLTWNDETLYIMAVVLCDVLLWGSILFASDPIDIMIDRTKKPKKQR